MVSMSGDINCKSNFVSCVLADVIIFVYEVPFIFWHYINVDEVSWITLKKFLHSAMELLQIAMDGYYKLRQLFYYKVRNGLLQIATGITKCDDYYKLRQYSERFVDQCRAKTILSPLYFKILSIVSVQQ